MFDRDLIIHDSNTISFLVAPWYAYSDKVPYRKKSLVTSAEMQFIKEHLEEVDIISWFCAGLV